MYTSSLIEDYETELWNNIKQKVCFHDVDRKISLNDSKFSSKIRQIK